MKKLALLAQWAGDFEVARQEYDKLLNQSLDRSDPVEARLLYVPQILCQLVFSMEHGEERPLEVLNVVTKAKEVQAIELFSKRIHRDMRKEDLLRAALRAGQKITARAVKRLMFRYEKQRSQHDLPLRDQQKDRFVSVFRHPSGLEARSYCRADITIDIKATFDKLSTYSNSMKVSCTERMLAVVVGGEVLEIFVDGRIRCVSKSEDRTKLAELIQSVGMELIMF